MGFFSRWRKTEQLASDQTRVFRQSDDDAQPDIPETRISLSPKGVHRGRIKDVDAFELTVYKLAQQLNKAELQEGIRQANRRWLLELLRADDTSFAELVSASLPEAPQDGSINNRADLGEFTLRAMRDERAMTQAMEAQAYNQAMYEQEAAAHKRDLRKHA